MFYDAIRCRWSSNGLCNQPRSISPRGGNRWKMKIVAFRFTNCAHVMHTREIRRIQRSVASSKVSRDFVGWMEPPGEGKAAAVSQLSEGKCSNVDKRFRQFRDILIIRHFRQFSLPLSSLQWSRLSCLHKKKEREGKIFVAAALKASVDSWLREWFFSLRISPMPLLIDSLLHLSTMRFLREALWGVFGVHAKSHSTRGAFRVRTISMRVGAGDRRGGWRNLCSVASRCQAYTDVTRFGERREIFS